MVPEEVEEDSEEVEEALGEAGVALGEDLKGAEEAPAGALMILVVTIGVTYPVLTMRLTFLLWAADDHSGDFTIDKLCDIITI